MKMTATDAMTLAQALMLAAQKAQSAGQTEFDLGDELSAQAGEAIDELQKQIDAK